MVLDHWSKRELAPTGSGPVTGRLCLDSALSVSRPIPWEMGLHSLYFKY